MKNKEHYLLNGINDFLKGVTYVNEEMTEISLNTVDSDSHWSNKSYKKGYFAAKEMCLKERLHDDTIESIVALHFKFQKNNTHEAVFTPSYIDMLSLKIQFKMESETITYPLNSN